MIDKTGRTFGRLTVLGTFRRNGQTWAACRCACGVCKDVRACQLGRISSCGCLRSEYRRSQWLKHGESNDNRTGQEGSSEYRAWRGMINRCEYGDEAHRRAYAARGITVCARWRNDYKAFLADVGRRPSPEHSLDRFPNNAGNYEPGNVRWATRSEQAKNRRPRPRVAGMFAGGVL